MSPRTKLFAPLFAGFLVTGCGASSLRGVTNMQPDNASDARYSSAAEPAPSLECKAASHRCGGDDECCSNLCVEQRCTAPRP